jgi:hypothetical protein
MILTLASNLTPLNASSGDQLSYGFFFIPPPRPLMGEPPMQLPNTVSINLGSSNIPQTVWGTYDIIFTPSGQVVGPTNNGLSILWVQTNLTNPSTGNPVVEPTLVVVYNRTGGVASHPVAAGGNPYAYAQDGFNSGL